MIGRRLEEGLRNILNPMLKCECEGGRKKKYSAGARVGVSGVHCQSKNYQPLDYSCPNPSVSLRVKS